MKENYTSKCDGFLYPFTKLNAIILFATLTSFFQNTLHSLCTATPLDMFCGVQPTLALQLVAVTFAQDAIKAICGLIV